MYSSSAVSALGQAQGCGVERGWAAEPELLPPLPSAAAMHAEPYLMFSTDKKSLLCIRCFRDMQGSVSRGGERRACLGASSSLSAHPSSPHRESRAHCVDLESAYVQGCERLEQAVLVRHGGFGLGGVGDLSSLLLSLLCPQAVKALQAATREAIELLHTMVEEVRGSAAEEEAAIHALFGSMQVRAGRGWDPSIPPPSPQPPPPGQVPLRSSQRAHPLPGGC